MEDPLLSFKTKLKIKPVANIHEKVNVIIKNDIDIERTDEQETDSVNPAPMPIRIIDKQNKSFDRASTIQDIYDFQNTRGITVVPENKTKKNIVDGKTNKKINKLIIEEDIDEDNHKIKADGKHNKKKLIIEAESQDQDVVPNDVIINPAVKTRPKKEKGVVVLGPEVPAFIGTSDITQRLPKKGNPIQIKADSYYMNNREVFINFINALFEPYKKDLDDDAKTISCESMKNDSNDFTLLTHQKIVRDYLNLYTPYRGLLLYHGLGSGKTCSSIAIAEGMKTHKKVIIMTPASLRMNYMEELKKCGDAMYKKNQYWEWIDTDGDTEKCNMLSSVLTLPVEYIEKKKGAWLVNVKKKTNYDTLPTEDKKSVNDQLDTMISNKYTFINFNGLRSERFREMNSDYTINIFDNKIIIIDEAHNLISRIVNKIKKQKKIPENELGEKEKLPDSLAMKLYEMLLSAKNARIVLLTGTPVINYPNEFGILFNILRGYIKTWYLTLIVETSTKVDLKELQKIFATNKQIDYIDYSPSTKLLTVTRNPFGFKNKIKKEEGYKGVSNINRETKVFETEDISDEDFQKLIVAALKKNQIKPSGTIKIKYKKALPDDLDAFSNNFIDFDTKELKNTNALKRRILGLSSYFRSAHESLLPKFEKKIGVDYHIVRVPMSDFQFQKYEEVRQQERKVESNSKKKGKSGGQSELYDEPVSTYKIFSRLFCNFVMPDRPMPIKHLKDDAGIEDIYTSMVTQETTIVAKNNDNLDEELEGDEIIEAIGDATYADRIAKSIQLLEHDSDKFLSTTGLETYSPKFLSVLENILDENHPGLHLLYSQFRTLEGIGIFSLVLEKHGFARFKIRKNGSGIWHLDMKSEDVGKPTFALYTGTETAEEKEIVRNVYNGNWKYVPATITTKLQEQANNNNMGEIIKVLMITSSGSEGINLENTRYVHIMEPYWHPIRTQQVIGRALRICSHKNLPKELQTVEVFSYLMTFTEKQMKSEISVELRKKDLSRMPPKVPVSTDQLLHEMSDIKSKLSSQLTGVIQESAFDCFIYGNKNCFNFANSSNAKFSFLPDYADQKDDSMVKSNVRKVKLNGKKITIAEKEYVAVETAPKHYNIYDFNSYNLAIEDSNKNPLLVATLEINISGKKILNWVVS